MASQPTSSSTPSEDRPFFCCPTLFDKISTYAISVNATTALQGMISPEAQPPAEHIPTTTVSSAEIDSILSASPLVIQVMDKYPIHQLPGVPSTYRDTKPKYFAAIVTGGESKIWQWGEIEIKEEELRERGIKSTGTSIYNSDCPEHDRRLWFSLWRS